MHTLLPSASTLVRSWKIAASCLCLGVVALVATAKDEPALSASSNRSFYDLDMDGLSDAHELVIGTQPNAPDPDGDGFSDLEEYTRGSDPNDLTSIPDPVEFAMNLGASQVEDTVTLLATIYTARSKVDQLRLEFGIVYQGQLIRFYPRTFGASRAYRVRASNPADRLAVVEIPMPAGLVRRMGQLNVASILRDTSPVPSEPAVSLLPLVNFSGITMRVEQTPATLNVTGGGRPAGIVYRPLAGDGQLPSSWNGGEICFQRTAAVGVNGVSIVFEIEGAGCVPMDTYCSPVSCSAGVGRSIDLPDPAALAGG
jgi:hypothetical protein